MIELTAEQHQALVANSAEPVRAIDPATNAEYVLVRAEVYERIKALLYDDGDWTPEEQLRLLADSGQRAGWDDPEMDVYDQYDENLKKLWQ
jgi:hypothetical protein